MAAIPVGGCIDRYEASAGSGSIGSADGRDTTLVAASVAGKMPAADVTLAQATKGCLNARKHLCDEKEWLSACKNTMDWHKIGNPPLTYPYGPTFQRGRCNDWDASDRGHKGAAPTGSFPGCVSPSGVYDLANNVAEWVSTPEESGGYALRGGNYFNAAGDSSCEEDDNVLSAMGHHSAGGFRCCLVAADRRGWW